MDLASYMFIEPARDSQLFRDLEDLADNWPNRLAKCCNAIDAFVLDVYTPGYRVAPPTPGIRDQPDLSASVEVYLVPHLFEGPAALLRVDHVRRTITYVAVYSNYDGDDHAAQWQRILDLARSALE